MSTPKVPKECPVCGVVGTVVKTGKKFHCTASGCGRSFPPAYIFNKEKASKASPNGKAQG